MSNNKISLQQLQKQYLEAKEYLNLIEQLDYSNKMKLVKENPYLFLRFNLLESIVKELEDLGIHLTIKKAD